MNFVTFARVLHVLCNAHILSKERIPSSPIELNWTDFIIGEPMRILAHSALLFSPLATSSREDSIADR